MAAPQWTSESPLPGGPTKVLEGDWQPHRLVIASSSRTWIP